MNNVTTFETSQRLEAAGFPQPVPEFGQVWYEPESEEQYICIKPANLLDRTFAFIRHNGCGNLFFAKEIVFAPTATDILSHLPNIVYRRYGKAHWQLGELTLPEKGPHIVDFYKSHDENDAEMLAKKWLSLNEKTEQK